MTFISTRMIAAASVRLRVDGQFTPVEQDVLAESVRDFERQRRARAIEIQKNRHARKLGAIDLGNTVGF